jgi:hypothetical protein
MDSEDDMHDANDIESLDDDFYSGETEDVPMDFCSDYDDDDDADDYFDDGDDSDPAESRRTEVFLLPFCLFFVALLIFHSIFCSAGNVAYKVCVFIFYNELRNCISVSVLCC